MWYVRSAAFNILLIALPVAINGGVNIVIIPLVSHQARFLPTVSIYSDLPLRDSLIC